ncbi:Outer membrane receptor for ferrienterochelin and colicins [Robiginitalea myxolifaciens]|uniref:Outer membrane receptor for ferrienterochelin and colicins n=1 Tax=Robiginitalea myxolifaciens TaxID=400055 RepID=A0A1I6HGM6_9FLAO|nr:TonB-dependent receptor plug domain-containing protein [Robiginitalea myxolifaciens]SFR53643.1 Outer membrane receptor for ferrienterochelin and colicins [Robiginitalea myxolifaciens]
MLRTPLKVLLAGCLFCVLISTGPLLAQENISPSQVSVIELLGMLQERDQVRFSYLDEDLEGMRVRVDTRKGLDEILTALRQQTQLDIKALDNRYYSVSRSPLVRVCATVFDNFGAEPVSGASVEVLGSSLAAVTDASGRFEFEGIPRGATLGIRHIGFKPLYIRADEFLQLNPCKRITLAVRYQQLDEVVVMKYLTTGLSKESNGSVLLKTDEFGLLPGLSEPDILQTIQALPGIKSISETVSDINIRGGTNDQNLILWDGIKMYQSGHFFGLISAFNPYLTQSVEIIKNGASARYGDGLSGILNMRTHDRVARTYYGGAGFNLISGDAYLHLPVTDRMAVQVSARRSVTDVFNTPTYANFSDRAFQDTQISTPSGSSSGRIQDRSENFFFYDFSAKLLYDFRDNHQFRVSGIFIRNNLFYSETLTADNSENRSDLNQLNAGVSAVLRSQWNASLSSEILGYFTQYDLDSQYLTEGSGQTLFQENQVAETAFKSRFAYRFNPELQWSFGYQFIGTGISNTSVVNQPPLDSRVKDVLYANALFSEWNYRGPGSRLNTTAGLRLNYFRNPEDFDRLLLEPRLSLQYRLSDDIYLEALGEFKNQTSLQRVDLEQNFLGIEKRRWILADEEDLPLVTSRQGSLGLHYDRGFWLASIDGFYKEVEGITTDTQGFQNEGQFGGEIGNYSVHGVEALLNYKNEAWSTWISYAWNQNEYFFEDLDPQVFPNNLDVRHSLSAGSVYAYGDLKVGVGLHYRTGRPYTQPQPEPNAINTTVFPNRINFQPPNSSRLPEYIRADASVTYDFRFSETVRATAGASILNLTSRKNLLNRYYRLTDQNEVEMIESISLGLTPNLSFRVRF